MRRSLLLLALALLLVAPATPQTRRAAKTKKSPSPLSAREIAEKTLPSVVTIIIEDENGKALTLGSGFQVRPGTIATNYHVIKDASRASATFQGGNPKYEIVGTLGIDKENDLALLRLGRVIEQDPLDAIIRTDPLAEALTMATTSSPEIGDTVYVAGNPEGLEGTFSQGIVSALRGSDYIQITAPISHGSSGGPVLNKYGEVIGIAVGAIQEGQNLNFAIPVAKLRALINKSATSVRPLAPQTNDSPSASTANKPAPSREETASWLNGKLTGIVTYLTPSSSGGYRVRIERLDFEGLGGCNMDLTVSTETQSVRFVYKYSPVLELAESASAGRNKDGDWAVWISFGRAIYKFKETYDGGRLIRKEEERTNTIALFIGEEELANRAANAFSHLIQLCGGGKKKEPF